MNTKQKEKIEITVNEVKALCNNYDSRTGRPVSVNDKAIKDNVLSGNHVLCIGTDIYFYSGGAYEHDEHGKFTLMAIEKLMEDCLIKSNIKQRILNLFLQDPFISYKMTDMNNYSNSIVNFKNCMFDVKKWKAIKQDPCYRSIEQVPHSIDESINKKDDYSKHPVFTKFINNSIPNNDDREMLLQYMGLCLTKDPSFQTFMIIHGCTDSGKSVIANLINEMVGDNNATSISLNDIAVNRFKSAKLYNKKVNVCADIDSKSITDTGLLKQLTGEDMITAENKGKDPFEFRSHAKLLFSCNTLPKFPTDKSQAVYNRLRILEMNINIPKEKQDRNLLTKLKHEMPYIIETCLRALNRAYTNNVILDSKRSIEKIMELQSLSDSVTAFLDVCMEKKSGNKITRKDCFDAYRLFCIDEEREPLTKKNFFADMGNKGYTATKTGNDRVYKGIDIAWTEIDDELLKEFQKAIKRQ